MIKAEDFTSSAKEYGFFFYTGVPCSYLKPLINHVIDDESIRYIGAANEGDAVAIASGYELSGKNSVVIFQNSGLGNAVNPLTSLNMVYKIPVLLIVTMRAEPGGRPDEPQHRVMGRETRAILEAIGIPCEKFPEEIDQVGPALRRASGFMRENKTPFAFLLSEGSLDKEALKQVPVAKEKNGILELSYASNELSSRGQVLKFIQESSSSRDVIISTTGHTSRELLSLDDKDRQFYMVGSMGCVSSLALGLSAGDVPGKIVVIDGDGAALMRLGAWATIGYERPKSLIHVLLDNESHASTGGQSTVSHSVDFATIAHAW